LDDINAVSSNPDFLFRLESFPAGHGNVGIEASKDDRWMKSIYEDLLKCWKEQLKGHILFEEIR